MIYYQMENGYCDQSMYDDIYSYCLSNSIVRHEPKTNWLFEYYLSNVSVNKLRQNNIIDLCCYWNEEKIIENNSNLKCEQSRCKSVISNQYVPALGRANYSNGQKLPCHGGWIENLTTINGAGFKPGPLYKKIQLVPYNESVGKHRLWSNVISNKDSSVSCSTNKIICYNRHIALNSQVSTAILDPHMVDSSGCKMTMCSVLTKMKSQIHIFRTVKLLNTWVH